MKNFLTLLLCCTLLTAFTAAASPGESTVIQTELSLHKADMVNHDVPAPAYEVRETVQVVMQVSVPNYQPVLAVKGYVIYNQHREVQGYLNYRKRPLHPKAVVWSYKEIDHSISGNALQRPCIRPFAWIPVKARSKTTVLPPLLT